MEETKQEFLELLKETDETIIMVRVAIDCGDDAEGEVYYGVEIHLLDEDDGVAEMLNVDRFIDEDEATTFAEEVQEAVREWKPSTIGLDEEIEFYEA